LTHVIYLITVSVPLSLHNRSLSLDILLLLFHTTSSEPRPAATQRSTLPPTPWGIYARSPHNIGITVNDQPIHTSSSAPLTPNQVMTSIPTGTTDPSRRVHEFLKKDFAVKLEGESEKDIRIFYEKVCLACSTSGIPILPVHKLTKGATTVCPPDVTPEDREHYGNAIYSKLMNHNVIARDGPAPTIFQLVEANVYNPDGYHVLTQMLRTIMNTLELVDNPFLFDQIKMPTWDSSGYDLHELAIKFKVYYDRQHNPTLHNHMTPQQIQQQQLRELGHFFLEVSLVHQSINHLWI